MTISRNTLRTNSWDVIYTYLHTTNAISTNNIFSAMNSTLVESKGYPIVIIGPPSVTYMKLNVDGTMTESTVTMFIEVYDDNAQDTKSMADEVTAKLMAGRNVFAGQRLMNMEIDGGDYDSWNDGRKKIHRISFNVSFRYIEC